MNLSKRFVFDTNRKMGLKNFMIFVVVSWFCSISTTCVFAAKQKQNQTQKLRFDKNGEFKILQVADMHYANGKNTLCEDILPSQNASCTDLNTTAFIHRMILAEKPNLIVFTGIVKFLFNFWFYLLLFLVLGKKCFFPCENVL
jgi:predicted MPP superfamily phosphohydrolase